MAKRFPASTTASEDKHDRKRQRLDKLANDVPTVEDFSSADDLQQLLRFHLDSVAVYRLRTTPKIPNS